MAGIILAIILIADVVAGCYLAYWQGRRDQAEQDKKIVDDFKAKVFGLLDKSVANSKLPEPDQPDYINKQ